MTRIIFLAAFLVSIFMMMKTKKTVPEGQTATEPLTGQEKMFIWVLSLLSPILVGATFYYGWKKKLPVKAKQANSISLWAFILELALGFVIVFLLAGSSK